MKYVRTKNEVIDLTKLPNLDINDRGDITWYDDAEKYGHMIEYEDIIKIADTLEEVCDEFVIVNNADKRPYRINREVFYSWGFQITGHTCLDYAIETFNKLKEFVGSAKNHCKEADYLYKDNPDYEFNGCVKGAIWTDKGLIYVAEIDETKKED